MKSIDPLVAVYECAIVFGKVSMGHDLVCCAWIRR